MCAAHYLPEKETNTRLLSKPTGGTRNSRKEKKDLDELLDGIESNGEGETELDRGPTTIKSEHRSASFLMFWSCKAKSHVRTAGSEGSYKLLIQ